MAGIPTATVSLQPFKKAKTTAATLVDFDKYVKQVKLCFQILRVAGVTAEDSKVRRAYLEIWGGADMEDLLLHTADPPLQDDTSFDNTIEAVRKGLSDRINDCYPMYHFFQCMPQGRKGIADWMAELLDAAKRLPVPETCNCTKAYTHKRLARDAAIFQTSNDKLRSKALTEGYDYDKLLNVGQNMEEAKTQTETMEKNQGTVGRLETGTEPDTEGKEETLEEKIERIARVEIGKNRGGGNRGRGRGGNRGRGGRSRGNRGGVQSLFRWLVVPLSFSCWLHTLVST